MVALIATLSYGFDETVAKLSGWLEPMCIMACFALIIVLEEIVNGIVFSKLSRKITVRASLHSPQSWLFF